MKRLLIAAGFAALGVGLVSCGGAHGDDPGHAYMPDMYYSRAYETYSYNDVHGELDSLKHRGIYYSAMPVPGTVARGDMMSYHLAADSASMQSAEGLKSPLDSTIAATKGNMTEAERLYLVNCAICHGPALDGNGPLYNNGNGPYPVAPRNLKDDYTKKLTDGHIYYVMTFGIRTMGSYASQLTPIQRWWVIKYLRSKQGPLTPATDSTSKAKPAMAGGTTDTASKATAKK